MNKIHIYVPLLAVLIVLGVNAAANILPINGYETGELSDLNPTGFTPAGYVFSIWNIIYVGLIAYGFSFIYASTAVRERGDSIRQLFLINAAANAAWIFAWHYRLVELSLVFMLVILVTLWFMHAKLRSQGRPTFKQAIVVDAPFSLYFGWISTATLANLGAVFYSQQFYPFALTMDQWALVTVITAIALYVWMGVITRDIIYCCVFIWASIGIYYQPVGISAPVRLAALTGTFLLLLTVIWIAYKKFASRRDLSI